MPMDLRLDEIKAIPAEDLEAIVTQLKRDVLTLVHDASGHCGGSLSSIRSLLVYYSKVHDESMPELHLSKGHCVPALYAIGHMFGNITDEEMANFRNALLSGHAEERVQAVPAGLLGEGPGVTGGRAEGLRLSGIPKKAYVACGDGELDEGATWESIELAATRRLNVCYIIDHNGRNLTGELAHDFDKKLASITSLGVSLIRTENTIDGLIKAYARADSTPGPVALVVDSVKGEGVSFMEQEASGWHGNPLTDEQYTDAMKELGLEPTTFKNETSRVSVVRDTGVAAAVERLKAQGYGLTSEATRSANSVLAELGKDYGKLVVIIPDIGKSVKTGDFAKAFPDRHIDVGIKEMTAVLHAMGLAVEDYMPVVSTFDGFSLIPASAIRMADYGNLSIGFAFTHAEFIGEDGPSHLTTENLGFWNGLHNIMTIANPADIVQAKHGLVDSFKEGGMFYVRLGRPKVPTVYTEDTVPAYGKADVLIRGDGPTLVTTGQEVWESLIAAEMLKADGINATVVNVAYFRPFDSKTINAACSDRLVVVPEAHKSQVGLASMVALDLMMNGTPTKGFLPLGVNDYVHSASIEAQKHSCGLLGEQIYAATRRMMGK